MSALSSHPFRSTHRPLEGGGCLVELEGDLDLGNAPQLKWSLVELLRSGQTRFVVDLSQVQFVDSTALGVLIGFERSLPEGGRLAIVASSPGILKIFELTGLDQRFDLFGTADAAVHHLGRG